jgi:transposase
VFSQEAPASSPATGAATPEPPPRARLDEFTLTQVKWFLVRDYEALTEPEQAHLVWLCQAHPTLGRLYNLVQAFRRLLKYRQGHLLEGWIADCQASGIPELAQFATGLLREREWVVAGLTHSASNDHVAYCTSSLGSRSF